MAETEKKEPTHYSELDPKTMSLPCLRKELEARNVNNKGLKSQLVARLTKCLKQEASKDQPAENAGDVDIEEPEAEAEVENSVVTVDDQNAEDVTKKKDEEKEKNQEKEDALWKSRHVLPASPHLIVHPSRLAKSGKFDCTVMTLSLLLDYRPEDSKEHSFEVSLFAELFNEMLMRDFGFNIYKALYVLPDKSKDEKDDRKKDDSKKTGSDSKDKKSLDDEKDKKSDNDKDKKDSDKKTDSRKDDKGKNSDKRDDASSFGDEENSNDRKSVSGDKKDKKDKQKLVTRDPHLLLSFVYFDTSHCGYIFEKDIEELLYTLGLNLSRAQVRKLVSKVVTRETFHYRRLTDKAKDEIVENRVDSLGDDNIAEGDLKDMDISELAAGNKRLLPVFKDKKFRSESSEPPNKKARTESSENEGFVSYKGGLLDIEKLMNQLKRSEQARLDTEAKLVEIKEENVKVLEKQAKYVITTTSLSNELDDTKKKLVDTQNSLSRMSISSKIFFNALKEIETKAMSVVHTNLYDDPDSIKICKQETTSRWSNEHSNSKNDSGEGCFKSEPKFSKDEANDAKQKSDDSLIDVEH